MRLGVPRVWDILRGTSKFVGELPYFLLPHLMCSRIWCASIRLGVARVSGISNEGRMCEGAVPRAWSRIFCYAGGA